MGIRTTRRNGIDAFIIGPIAIPYTFLVALGVVVGGGWLVWCLCLDLFWEGNGLGAALFFGPLLGVIILAAVIFGLITLIRQFIDVNRRT